MKLKKIYNYLVNLISIIAIVSILFSLASNIYAIGEGQDDDIDADIYAGEGTPEDPSTEPVDGGNTMKIYTIEDLFFNRIPLLDANFFSETAGGKEINEGSTIAIIRKVVRLWYISFRNVAIVVIAVVIIFAGVKMAISTVAEDKGNYKKMLVSWTKALVIVLVMHFFMYAIQYFNAKMLEILQDSLANKYGAEVDPDTGQPIGNTGQVYNTIVKRAFDVRYKVGIPGAIMYLVLTIYFVRFCFIYVRRYAGLMILTILAPLVAIKHAVLSLNGKSSNEFSKWLGDYTTTTFLQSIHALVFLTLVTTAIDLALVNIGGFVIALLMLHAVTHITVLATQIFNFNSNGGGGSFISELLVPGADSAPILSSSTYLNVKTWQSIGKSFKGLKNSAINTKDAIKDSKVTKKLKDVTGITEHQKKKEELIRATSGEDLEETYNDDGTVDVAATKRILRRNQKRKNSQGKAAKTIIKGLKNYQGKKMFTGGVKQAIAMAGGFMSIPLAVTSDSQYETGHTNLGMALGLASTDLFISGGNDVLDGAKMQTKKKKEKYNKVMNNVVVGNRIMDTLDDDFASLDKNAAYIGRGTLRTVNKYNVNSFSLKNAVRTSILLHNIKVLDASNVDLVVNDVMKRSKINIRVKDPDQRARYKQIIKDTLLENKEAINDSISSGSIYDDELGDSDVIENARDRARNGVPGLGDMGYSGDAHGGIGPGGADDAAGPGGADDAVGPGGTDGALGPGDSEGGRDTGSESSPMFASGTVQELKAKERAEHQAKLIEAQLDHIDIETRRLQGRKTELERKIAQLGGKSELEEKELKQLSDDLAKLDSEKATLLGNLKNLTAGKYETRKTSEELRSESGTELKGKGFAEKTLSEKAASGESIDSTGSSESSASTISGNSSEPKGIESTTDGGATSTSTRRSKPFATRITSEELRGQLGERAQKKDFAGDENAEKVDPDHRIIGPSGDANPVGPMGDAKPVGPFGNDSVTKPTEDMREANEDEIDEARKAQSDLARRMEAVKITQRTVPIMDVDSTLDDTESKMRELESRLSEVERLTSSEEPVSQADIDRQLDAIRQLEESINETLKEQGAPAARPEATSSSTTRRSTTSKMSGPRASAPSNSARVRSSNGGFVDMAQILSDRLTGQIVQDIGGEGSRFTDQAIKFNTIRDINQVSGKQGVNPYSLDQFITELK